MKKSTLIGRKKAFLEDWKGAPIESITMANDREIELVTIDQDLINQWLFDVALDPDGGRLFWPLNTFDRWIAGHLDIPVKGWGKHRKKKLWQLPMRVQRQAYNLARERSQKIVLTITP